MERLAPLAPLKGELQELKPRAESISRQLRGWCQALQNSEMRGARHVNDSVRRRAKEEREREDFLRELEQIKNEARAGKVNRDTG